MLTMTAALDAAVPEIGLDLDPLLEVYRVSAGAEAQLAPVEWRRDGGRIFIELPAGLEAGDPFSVRVEYGGQPRVAPMPPWDGGFTWSRASRTLSGLRPPASISW